MRINTNRGSAIELTKRERDALYKATVICAMIRRHSEGEIQNQARIASATIEAMINFIDNTESQPPCPTK